MKARTCAATGMIAAVAALLLVGCADSEADPPRIKSTVLPGVAPTPPAQGAYFGAFVEPSRFYRGKPGELRAVTGFEASLGRELDVVHAFREWEQPFPRESDTAVMNSNRYLLLTWDGTDTRAIVSGGEDQVIRERARAIKATGKPVFVRWQPEMDRSALRSRVNSAADYVSAWKRIRALFLQEQVDNVAWVWCPTAAGFAADGDAADYYPGDEQVDWLCADAYPGSGSDYRNVAESIGAFMEWAKARPKPVMVGEFGVPRSYAARRAEWLRKAAQTLQNPQIKAVIYYDSDKTGRTAGQRYSLGGDQAATSALRELATTPYFNPRNLPVTST
ncbi:glycosyl hydrolase [Actinomadura alba]|nr:glycosyl hydrolase [Actinomadura alba]